MKKIGILLFALLGYFMNAQTTCETAAPFCASGVSGVTFPATENSGSAQAGPYYGCLGTVPNPSWYYLQVSTSGNLKILIQGQIVSPPGPGQDVDFICWGPFSSLAGICNSLTINNVVDCSYSNSFTETLTIPTGISGQYYLVLITNFCQCTPGYYFSAICRYRHNELRACYKEFGNMCGPNRNNRSVKYGKPCGSKLFTQSWKSYQFHRYFCFNTLSNHNL